MKLHKFLSKTLVAGLVGLAGAAYAVAPANTTITNTAQLNYTGLTSPILASVEVTVTLTPSAPQFVNLPADQTTAENQSASYLYTITATANGGDTYNLSSTLTPSNLASSSTSAVFSQGITPITSVTLGATAANAPAASGTAVISVPSDGVADSAVNNISAGDTVVIGGNVYTVLSISDNGVTASITLTSNLVAPVAVGDLIAEQQTFTATIQDVGSVNPSGAPNPNIIMDVTATSVSDGSQVSLDQTITSVVEVTFAKYVRNDTNPNGSGPAVIINTQPFYPTSANVTAESGDLLEYALVVTAPSTALNGVSLMDSIPEFTSYEANSTTLNGVGISDVGGQSPLVGGMAANSSGEASGTVAASQTATVTFQVTVD